MPILISTESQDVAYSSTFTVPTDCTYVVALIGKTSGGATPTVTLNSVTMPSAAGVSNTDSLYASIHTLASPATGARTFAISTSSDSYRVTLAYLKQVDSGSPVVATATASGDFVSSFSLNCTSVADALVLDVIVVQSTGTVTVGAGQTAADTTSFASTMRGVSSEVATGTSTTMSWTTSAAQRQAHIAIAIRDGGAGGTSTPAFGRFGVRGPVR